MDKQRANNLFLMMKYSQRLRALPTSMQYLDLDSKRRNPRWRPRRDFGVTRRRRDRDFEKRVSKHTRIRR